MLASQMADRFLASKQDLTAEAKGRLRALQAEGFGRRSQAAGARRISNLGLAEPLTADSDARVELLWILATNTDRPEQLALLQSEIEALAAKAVPHSARAICLDIALGNIQRVRGNFGEAARLLFQAYHASDLPALALAKIEATRLLGRVWGDAGNDDAALELNRTVIEFENANGNTFMLGMARGYRGIYLNNSRRFEEALPELEASRASHQRFFASASEAHIENEFCRARIGLRQWGVARLHCDRAKEKFILANETGFDRTELLTAEIDLAEERLGDARRRLDDIIGKGATAAGINLFEAFRLRAELHQRQGDYPAALSDLYAYIQKHGRWKEAATARQTLVLSERFAAVLHATRAEALQKTLELERQTARVNSQSSLVMIGAMACVMLILCRMRFVDVRHQRRLTLIANTDLLTGIPNRRHILERAKEALAAARGTGRAFSVALLDLDHFKAINDRFGHLTGDTALKQVAAAAEAHLPVGATMGRWGGEEFLIVFEGHGLDDCSAHLEKLRHEITLIRPHRDAVIPLNFSAGLSGNDDATLSIEQMINQADHALYRAKACGRGQTQRFQSEPRALLTAAS